MSIGSLQDIIRKTQNMVTAFEYGVEPVDYNRVKQKKDLSIFFGSDFVQKKEAEERRQDQLENRTLVYDEDCFEQYHLRYYHEEIKPWLDFIEEHKLPLELYKTDGKTKWHDGNYNWTYRKAILYRLLDTETKYMVDFELFDDEFGVDEDNILKGITCHIKYIHAKKEDQKGYFVLTKTVQRVAKLLFSQGIIQLNGWCFPMNEKEVHTSHNWRKDKVYGTARDGTKSDTKQTKLFWLYMYQGWVVTGQKQGDALISYFSKKLYDFCIASEMDVESRLIYARNFSYEY